MLCYRFNISVYCMKKEKRIKNTICKNDENWKDMRCFRLNSIYGYRKFIGNPFLDMILLKKPLCPSLCRHCFSIAKLIHSTQIHFRIWVESIVILVSYSRWQSFALCTKKKAFLSHRNHNWYGNAPIAQFSVEYAKLIVHLFRSRSAHHFLNFLKKFGIC